MKLIHALLIPFLALTPVLNASNAAPNKHIDHPRPMLAPNDPPEVFAYHSDMIVVGNIIATEKPQPFEVPFPGQHEPLKGPFILYTLNVNPVIKEDPTLDRAATVPANPRTVEIIIPATTASKPGGAFRPPTAPPVDPSTNLEFRTAAAGLTVSISALKPDAMFVFYLQNTGLLHNDRPLYLPIKVTPFNQRGDDAEARRAADPDQWNWGQPVDGLQLICLTPPQAARNLPDPHAVLLTRPGDPIPDSQSAPPTVRLYFALRNTGPNPRAANLFVLDNILALSAADAAGKKYSAVFPPAPMIARPLPNLESSSVLKPKQILFFGPNGATDSATQVDFDLPTGKYALTATYTSNRAEPAPKDIPLFQGILNAAPAALEIQPARPFDINNTIPTNSPPKLN